MSFLNIFKHQKDNTPSALPDETQQWNAMWDLWANGGAASPYAELMTYQSEVNNGGHAQFFDNVSSTDNLSRIIDVLYGILPCEHKTNLETAYRAFCASADPLDDEALDNLLNDCDNVFYEKESTLDDVLKAYAAQMIL